MTNSSPTDPIREALDPDVVERVAHAIRRERHKSCCVGAALDDICALPLRSRDLVEARAAISSMPTIAGDEERAIRLIYDLDVRGIALQTLIDAKQAGESREMTARWISERITRALQTLSLEHIRRGIDE